MKSVIINLKYLIFRSASASEGGSLEERQREGGMEDGKSRAVASVLSASATLKPALTKAQTVLYLFIYFPGLFSFLSPSRSCLFKTRCTYTVFLSAPPDSALVSVSATLAPSLNSTSNPQH